MNNGLRICIIAGEHSGDLLGGKLMEALNARLSKVEYTGVGGETMEAQGLDSLFPLSDVAVMGPVMIARRLPLLINRVRWAARAAIESAPDLVVIVDSPEFTHPIAKRIHRALPDVPILDYVSPSIWAWRPGRAKRMKRYVDHVMALLPFEPDYHDRLGGPRCTYVGHPMIERLDQIRADGHQLRTRLGLGDSTPVLVVLPGSRPSEVRLLMKPFGDAVDRLSRKHPELQVIVPAVSSVRRLIEEQLEGWTVTPHLVEGDDDKFAAFAAADAALAASGTVTLELALAGVPSVVAYLVDGVASLLRPLVKVPSIVLPNLVLGTNMYPEFIQEQCRGDVLAEHVDLLLSDTRERRTQLQQLAQVESRMMLDEGTPSDAAAQVVLSYAPGASDKFGSRA